MAGPSDTPLLLLSVLAMSPERDSREEEPHLDCAGWNANIKEEDVQEALNFDLREENKTRDHENPNQALLVVHTSPQSDQAWDELLPACGDRPSKMPNVDSCPFHEQPGLLRKKFWSFQTSVPRLGKPPVEKSSSQDAERTLTGLFSPSSPPVELLSFRWMPLPWRMSRGVLAPRGK